MKTYPKIILENNFILIPLTVNYSKQLFTLIENNRDRLEEYFPWPPSIKTIEDEEKAVSMLVNFMQEEPIGLSKMIEYVITNESDNAIGMVDFHTVNNENMSAQIGYWIDKNYEGKGIISNAVKELCNYGFNMLGLHEIKILVKSSNQKSINIPIRLNFTTDNIVDNNLITFKMNNNELNFNIKK